jgi:putative transposase
LLNGILKSMARKRDRQTASEPRVYLTEQHIIRANDVRFAEIDAAALRSKNLYNRANYLLRQEYFAHRRYTGYAQLDKQMKRNHEPDYVTLPAKVAQQVLMRLDENWRSFFAAAKAYQESPEEFRGAPHPPGYKHKERGRNALTYTIQAISGPNLAKGVIVPSGLPIEVQTQQRQVNQVRIVPRKDHYVVEVVYRVTPQKADLNADWIAAIDLGLNNLAALTSNKPGFVPLLVNGRPLKSLNQYYNEQRAHLQALLPKGRHTSHRIAHLTETRNRRIKLYLHTVSRYLIDILVAHGIRTLIIGKSRDWKYEINLGRQTNQNFVFVPHSQFIDMLMYKATLVGITVIVREESYTSRCSFLDDEPICKHRTYQGQRIQRGLFRSSSGQLINADVNASYNILRKEAPNALRPGYGGEGAVVHPVRVTPSQMLSHSIDRSLQ